MVAKLNIEFVNTSFYFIMYSVHSNDFLEGVVQSKIGEYLLTRVRSPP